MVKNGGRKSSWTVPLTLKYEVGGDYCVTKNPCKLFEKFYLQQVINFQLLGRNKGSANFFFGNELNFKF